MFSVLDNLFYLNLLSNELVFSYFYLCLLLIYFNTKFNETSRIIIKITTSNINNLVRTLGQIFTSYNLIFTLYRTTLKNISIFYVQKHIHIDIFYTFAHSFTKKSFQTQT